MSWTTIALILEGTSWPSVFQACHSAGDGKVSAGSTTYPWPEVYGMYAFVRCVCVCSIYYICDMHSIYNIYDIVYACYIQYTHTRLGAYVCAVGHPPARSPQPAYLRASALKAFLANDRV